MPGVVGATKGDSEEEGLLPLSPDEVSFSDDFFLGDLVNFGDLVGILFVVGDFVLGALGDLVVAIGAFVVILGDLDRKGALDDFEPDGWGALDDDSGREEVEPLPPLPLPPPGFSSSSNGGDFGDFVPD